MQRAHAIRSLALGAMTLVAIGAFASCTVTSTEGLAGLNDAAATDSSSFDSGGAPDASGSDATAAVRIHAIAVNASPDLPDIRLCARLTNGNWITTLAIPDDETHPMPRSNYPGIPLGTGTPLPETLLPRGDVSLYAIVASKIPHDTRGAGANARRCWELVCPPSQSGCLEEGKDYFALPPLPTTDFAGGSSYLLALTGCVNPADGGERCWSGALRITTFRVDSKSYADNLDMGAQAVDLAPLLDGVLAAQAGPGASVRVTYGPTNGGAGQTTLTSSARYTTLTGGQAVPLPLLPADYAQQGIVVSVVAADAAVASRFAMPLSTIQRLSDPTKLPNEYFHAHTSYIFAIIGDPTSGAPQLSLPDGAANPAYDGRGLHVVAFPSTLPDAAP